MVIAVSDGPPWRGKSRKFQDNMESLLDSSWRTFGRDSRYYNEAVNEFGDATDFEPPKVTNAYAAQMDTLDPIKELLAAIERGDCQVLTLDMSASDDFRPSFSMTDGRTINSLDGGAVLELKMRVRVNPKTPSDDGYPDTPKPPKPDPKQVGEAPPRQLIFDDE